MMKVDKERIPEQEPKAENETYNYERFRIGLYEIDPLTGPRTGEKAPDFAAETVDGHKVHLSNYLGHPVVLITGSYTSPQYIDKIETMNRILYRHPEAMFLTLYVREAHPGNKVPPHRNSKDKRALAQRAITEDGEKAEVLLDDLEGSAHQKYGGLPNMSYVIDEQGTVVVREAWNNPQLVEKALDRLRRGESPGNIRAGFVPVSPLTVLRVLDRAGRDALGDVLISLPTLLAKHFSASVKEIRRPVAQRRSRT